MLFIFWIINHLFFIPLAYKKYGADLLVIGSVCLLSIYLLKSPSYDLIIYIENIKDSNFVYEPISNIFLQLIGILSFGYTPLYTVFITLILLLINVLGLISFQNAYERRYRATQQLVLAVSMVLLSLYFFLGSQNVLRQCLSISFFIYFMAAYFNNRKFICTIFIVLSALSHYGNFPIILAMIFCMLINLKLIANLGLGLIIGVIGVFALKFLAAPIDYLVTDFSFSDERSPLFIKWASISVIVITSTYFTSVHACSGAKLIKSILNLRLFLLGVLTSIFIFELNEMFSRLAVNLYALDMLLAFVLVNNYSRDVKIKYAVIIIIFSPALAPNIFQILRN